MSFRVIKAQPRRMYLAPNKLIIRKTTLIFARVVFLFIFSYNIIIEAENIPSESTTRDYKSKISG